MTNTAGTTINAGQLNGGATVSGGSLTNNNLIAGTVAISGTGTVNNNLTITGAVNNGATFNNNANSTVSGLLTNTAGTTTNAGQLKGGATVNGGTLTTTGTVAGGLTNNSGTVNASGTINGTITNKSQFTVTGTLTNNGSAFNNSGALSVGSNSFTGLGAFTNNAAVTVGSGGTLGATSFTDNASGTLTSTGILSLATLTNNGTLTAAGTINGNVSGSGVFKVTGALAIHGSLALASAATYMVTINGSSIATTTVSGTANLASAKLLISSSNVSLGQAYTVLTAGTVNGTFGSSTVSGNTYTETLTYTSKTVTATFSNPKLSPSALPSGFNSFVNTVNNAPSGSPLQNLVNIPQSSLLSAAGQASGQASSGGVPTMANMQSSFTTTLLNPNIGGRGGATGAYGPALGFAPEIPNTPEEQAAYEAVTPRGPLDALMKSLNQGYTHSVWASVYGGYASVTGASNVGSPTAITRGGGLASGIDYRFGRDTVVGFALGGGQTGWSLSNGLGNGTSDIFQAGLYGSQRFGNAYISGSLAYALDVMNTNRTDTISSSNLTAKFNANGVTGRLESGYRFGTPDLGVTPYLAGQFSALVTPPYSESASAGSGAVALSYQSQTTTDTRAEVGVWADKAFHLQDGATFWIRGRAGYAHDWWNNTFLNANFLSLPTSSFTMAGVTPPANIGLASVMSEIRGINGWSFGVKLDGEFASGAYSVGATGTLRYSW